MAPQLLLSGHMMRFWFLVVVSIVGITALHADRRDNRFDMRTEWFADRCVGGDDTGAVRLETCSGRRDQGFTWRKLPKGFIQIVWSRGGDTRCLDILNDNQANNRPVLTECADVTGQYWKVRSRNNGYAQLTTKWRGRDMCLDVINDGERNDQLWLTTCDNVSGQHWRLDAQQRRSGR